MSEAGAHVMTLREACVLLVAGLGAKATAPAITAFLVADGQCVSRSDVFTALYGMRGATVEVAQHGGGAGRPTRWRLTEAGRAWLLGECGESRCAA